MEYRKVAKLFLGVDQKTPFPRFLSLHSNLLCVANENGFVYIGKENRLFGFEISKIYGLGTSDSEEDVIFDYNLANFSVKIDNCVSIRNIQISASNLYLCVTTENEVTIVSIPDLHLKKEIVIIGQLAIEKQLSHGPLDVVTHWNKVLVNECVALLIHGKVTIFHVNTRSFQKLSAVEVATGSVCDWNPPNLTPNDKSFLLVSHHGQLIYIDVSSGSVVAKSLQTLMRSGNTSSPSPTSGK